MCLFASSLVPPKMADYAAFGKTPPKDLLVPAPHSTGDSGAGVDDFFGRLVKNHKCTGGLDTPEYVNTNPTHIAR